jgi:hypothetical protein
MTISNRKYAVFRYRRTRNLGDAIQTVALSRLLPGVPHSVERGRCRIPRHIFLIANGWLGNNIPPPPATSRNCLFAGVFLAQQHNLAWLRRSVFPIGARDPATEAILRHAGLSTEMIGCASLTFPRYRGRREGIFVTDAAPRFNVPPSAVVITHHLPLNISWCDQWTRAMHVLEIYRRAKLVYTSRLHAALPCLAFGTPIVFSCPDAVTIRDPLIGNRVSLLRFLGVEDKKVVTTDPGAIAASYRAFLSRYLAVEVVEHPPRFPHR